MTFRVLGIMNTPILAALSWGCVTTGNPGQLEEARGVIVSQLIAISDGRWERKSFGDHPPDSPAFR
jgi:hypothetical protein